MSVGDHTPDPWFTLSVNDLTTYPFVPGSLTVSAGTGGTVAAHGSGYFLAPEPDGPDLTADQYAVIEEVIIDSIARGYARRA